MDETLSNPEYRKWRASKAGKASHSLDTYIRRIVEHAAELTVEQKAKLAKVLEEGA